MYTVERISANVCRKIEISSVVLKTMHSAGQVYVANQRDGWVPLITDCMNMI